MKASDPELLCVRRFLITNPISLLVIGLFRFSTFSWFSLVWVYVYISPFLLGYPIYFHIIFHSSLLWSCFSIELVVNAPFHSDFICLSLCLFYVNVVKDLSILFILSKKQLFILLIFFCCFCGFYVIYICFDHCYFLPSAKFKLSFFFYFLVPCGIKLVCLVEIFLFS